MQILADVQKMLSELDPDLEPEDDGYKAALILLASCVVGPNQQRIREFTGLRMADVKRIGWFYRRNGIWRKDKIFPSDWFDEKNGGIAFWCDVACGEGLLQRTPS